MKSFISKDNNIITNSNLPLATNSYKEYVVNVVPNELGTVNASPTAGLPGTTVTLSYDTENFFKRYELSGSIFENDNTFKIGFTNPIIDGVFVEQPVVPVYEGFTISSNQKFSAISDPAQGLIKTDFAWNINQLDGSFTAKRGSLSFTPNDCWIQYAPSAGIYQCTVDRSLWEAYSAKSACGNQSYGTSISSNPNLKISLLSIDFALKSQLYSAAVAFTADKGSAKWMHTRLYDVPQASYNIHNYDNLTSISGLFSGAPITGAIEPFILSMNKLKPGIITTACFSGCTGAADYSHCLTAYPSWF